jgi:hypothetical protein
MRRCEENEARRVMSGQSGVVDMTPP